MNNIIKLVQEYSEIYSEFKVEEQLLDICCNNVTLFVEINKYQYIGEYHEKKCNSPSFFYKYNIDEGISRAITKKTFEKNVKKIIKKIEK